MKYRDFFKDIVKIYRIFGEHLEKTLDNLEICNGIGVRGRK